MIASSAVISVHISSLADMELMWLYSLCQCVLSMATVVASVRLCMAMSRGSRVQDRSQTAAAPPSSVSCCLRLCLGWTGAIGGAAGVPVTILLNLRTAQCLYTCITLVCCPMLVRHFTMFLLMLLTLDSHLQQRLGLRYVHQSPNRHPRPRCVTCWKLSSCEETLFYSPVRTCYSYGSDSSQMLAQHQPAVENYILNSVS